MKKLIYFTLASLLFSNCTHRIVRTGYDISKSDYRYCNIAIRKEIPVADTTMFKIGEIRLGETGFAVACSEQHAIDILRSEACALNADVIFITEENRPDLWSSCYRCKAVFYKYKNREQDQLIQSDEVYRNASIEQRVSRDRKRNTAIIVGSVISGLLIGLLLTL